MAVNPENFFNGNGSTTLFSFTFEYLEESDVKVSVDGVVKTQTTDYTFANATTISFNTAPASGTDNVRIYRDTNVDELKATFFPGSAIRADDLNDNLTQNNYAVQEIKAYTFDNETDTIHSNETWSSSDAEIATTAALDARFWDQDTDTIQSTETWQDSDSYIPTAAAVDSFVDEVITNDIGTDGTGITVTDDGDGTITLGIADNSVDFSKIKNADIITYAEQDAGASPSDENLFTANAAARRFDTLVQLTNPGTSSNWQVGKTWLQNDDDLTLSVWNGSGWIGVASGGTFTSLPKVVYVDSINGDDNNTGHRISTPKQTIRGAIQQINNETDANGNGSVVVVAPGVYAETFPIDIQKNDVSIVGTSLRNCIVHPAIPAADQAGYDVDVPEPNELTTMFRLNSGSYIQNLTLMGMKAAGPRGGNPLDTDNVHGLPTQQGWNFAFLPGATIRKSPYIQNCTNFSDSQINNVTFTPHVPGEGAAGDLDSAPTGGGILIDGDTPDANSPLRSMVCDSYTHTALDGPGIFVTNNGYCQATSSYSFFNHYHLKCLNGGQANLAASTTDFGRFSLIADGQSTTNIFTSNIDDPGGLLTGGQSTFNINAPVADASWHGAATEPQSNMLVIVNNVTYPILSATPHIDSEGGNGWTVEISRPDPTNRSNNLGINGAIADDAPVQFFLRSMIASSGHTMEYVGSGTNYGALPENGGTPVEANQKIELNNGAIWAAITDHNGKFTVGDVFEVDQQLGFVTIPNGAISFDLASDATPQLAANLDANSNRITNLTDPTDAQDAATKNYVDNEITGIINAAPATLDTLNELAAALGDDANFSTTVTNSLATKLPLAGGTMTGDIVFNAGQTIDGYVPQTGTTGAANVPSGATGDRPGSPVTGQFRFNTTSTSFEGYNGTSWGAVGGGATGGGTDAWALEHDNTITTNYTIGTGKNVINAGPMTINSGVTVTVPSGSSWSIV